MASSVEELVDMLFSMIDEAKNLPLSGDKCIIERDRALDLLDDIKAQLPVELAEAKKLIGARNDYIASAKREAELIRKQAEEKARQTLAEDELMLQVKKMAGEIRQSAEAESREKRRQANAYCEDVLQRTFEAVGEAQEEVKLALARFRSKAAEQAGPTGNQTLVYDAAAEQD